VKYGVEKCGRPFAESALVKDIFITPRRSDSGFIMVLRSKSETDIPNRILSWGDKDEQDWGEDRCGHSSIPEHGGVGFAH
jgi:hypothetical protein